MSVQTLYTAATGMDSLQTKLDVIANNLANINTTAFKRDRANFEDLFYRKEKLPGLLDSAGQITPVGIEIGLGSTVQSTQIDFNQGAFQQTSRPLDIAIEGNGFLQVIDGASGNTLYTRSGNLSINANGALVVGQRKWAGSLNHDLDSAGCHGDQHRGRWSDLCGSTEYHVADQRRPIATGQLPEPPRFAQIGREHVCPNGCLGASYSSGARHARSRPNPSERARSEQCRTVTELIDLITTQRAVRVNSQAIQAGDQILQLVGNLRRFLVEMLLSGCAPPFLNSKMPVRIVMQKILATAMLLILAAELSAADFMLKPTAQVAVLWCGSAISATSRLKARRNKPR